VGPKKTKGTADKENTERTNAGSEQPGPSKDQVYRRRENEERGLGITFPRGAGCVLGLLTV